MHAYLILAHRQDETLRFLISSIDDKRNELFVHLDKKAGPIDAAVFRTQHCHLHFVQRMDTNWGSFSLVLAELSLLTEATRMGHHAYYHLLSGQDLPIKDQGQIHQFFEKNMGKEFVSFDQKFEFDYRVHYFYPIQKRLQAGMWGRKCNVALQKIQQFLNIRRNQKINFFSGSQWFSISDDCARYVVGQANWIKKVFHHGFATDEIFLQTVLMDSTFSQHFYHSPTHDKDLKHLSTKNEIDCLRLVNWENGKPAIFKSENLQEIINSECLFARKFDEKVDMKIIERVTRN